MRPLTILALVALGGCGVYEDLVADHVIERQERIRSFEATYEERGTIPDEPSGVVRIRARFAAPASYVMEVFAPPEYEGDTVAYLGEELWFYSRMGNYGIHVRNVPFDAARAREAVRAGLRINRAAYDYALADDKPTIAGRVATAWTATPRLEGDLLLPSKLLLDDEFLIPLAVDLGAVYASRAEEIAFNRPVAPAFERPRFSTWFEFDAAEPSLSLEEARAFADFGLLEARDASFTRTRILRARSEDVRFEDLPIVTLVYEKGPFFASVTEALDRGYVDPGLRGVPVDLDGARGKLSFAGAANAVVFARGGVMVSILSNLPPHEAVAFAKTVR